MRVAEKRAVLKQVANVVVVMQQVEAGIAKHGGITFDDEGGLICGEMAIVKGGPWYSYDVVLVAKNPGSSDE